MAEIHPASRRMVVAWPDTAEGRSRRAGRPNVFKTILRAAAGVAAATVPVAGPAIRAAIDASDRRQSPLLGAIGGESETLRYLELQREIERETRMFETASNVLKARHDAAMSSIRNIKS
jgi:hypothetical protein